MEMDHKLRIPQTPDHILSLPFTRSGEQLFILCNPHLLNMHCYGSNVKILQNFLPILQCNIGRLWDVWDTGRGWEIPATRGESLDHHCVSGPVSTCCQPHVGSINHGLQLLRTKQLFPLCLPHRDEHEPGQISSPLNCSCQVFCHRTTSVDTSVAQVAYNTRITVVCSIVMIREHLQKSSATRADPEGHSKQRLTRPPGHFPQEG